MGSVDWTWFFFGILGGARGNFNRSRGGVGGGFFKKEEERERTARRGYRARQVDILRGLLETGERYLSSSFQRSLWDGTESARRDALVALGLDREQLDAARALANELYAPFPVPSDVIRDFTGPVMALEDEDLANHFFLIQMELAANHPPGFLEPQQIRLLLVRANQLLEKYASTVPLRRRTMIERIKRAIGAGQRTENIPREWEFGSLERLQAEIRAVKPSGETDSTT